VLAVGVGHAGTDAESAVGAGDLEGAAEQRGALAHPEDAVSAGGHVAVRPRRGRVGHRQLELSLAVGDLDVRAAAAVTGGVRERLLQDPVGGPVEAGREGTPPALDTDLRLEPGGPVAFDERLECREAGGRLGRSVRPVAGGVLAEAADQLIDLADRLPGSSAS
jgi:hypothetical protein